MPGCKSFVLEPQSWLLENPEALAHPTERPYTCSFCPKRFKRASDRRDHERVHTGERPYGCGVCGKRFTQSSVLSGHMRIHTGERPFRCGICFKSFNNGSNFRKHQRIHGQLFGHCNTREDEKDCDLFLGKKQSQLAEGQNGYQVIQEVTNGENRKNQDSKRWQGISCNSRIPQNDSLGQPSDNMEYFKGRGLSGHQMRQSSRGCIGVKMEDSKYDYGCLGDNGDCSQGSEVTENGHCVQPLRDVSGENHTEAMRSNKAGGSHTQGEQKQLAESCNDKLQLDGSSFGKGLSLVDGDRKDIHKQGQVSRVRSNLVRRSNGDYLKGLKHSSGEGIGTNMRQNGTRGSHLRGLNPNMDVSILEPRQNGSDADVADDLRHQNPGQFGVVTQDGGTNKEKWMDFQVDTFKNVVTPKVSSWTHPNESNVMAWEEPNIRIMKEKDEFEDCSTIGISNNASPWQQESPEPWSLSYDISASPHSHSQYHSHHWEENGSSPPSFSFQEPKTYGQHSLPELDSKPFLCFACPKQFRRATDLKEHLRVHTGERPFGCSVCGKRFTQSSALVTHRRLHTGEKPFECAVCYKRFNNSSNFAKHRRLHGQEGTRHGGKATVKDLWREKPH